MRAELPRAEELMRRWLKDGRNVGSLAASVQRLLDLYGARVVAAAVDDLFAKGCHDIGPLAIRCEQRRTKPRRILPIQLGPHVVDRDVFSTTSEAMMTRAEDPAEAVRALGICSSA